MSKLLHLLGFSLLLVSPLPAQQSLDDDPQRVTLVGLRRFAIHAHVQGTDGATLPKLDLSILRTKLEAAIRQEGLELQAPGDVRDGAAAQVSLVYLVIPIKDQAGHQAGFAASSCLQAAQLVRIPRVIANRRITYAVAPTWSSCAMMVGDTAAYRDKILGNADEQIGRFLRAWRAANKGEISTQRQS